MIPRPDLRDARTPAGVEVFQLTDDPALPSCHLYMEAQIFTPDSRRFLLHRSAHVHGSDRHDPRHRYQVCDLEHGGALTDLTHETGATAPSITPDGHAVYYFIDETNRRWANDAEAGEAGRHGTGDGYGTRPPAARHAFPPQLPLPAVHHLLGWSPAGPLLLPGEWRRRRRAVGIDGL